jgi:FkbH-like protein
MFERHPEMKLRRSDFAAARINWQPKSQSLRELAAALNLGLDAFVFVDDDPANRLEVETNAPGVVVVPLPAEPAEYCQTLSRLWCFDTSVVTAET